MGGVTFRATYISNYVRQQQSHKPGLKHTGIKTMSSFSLAARERESENWFKQWYLNKVARTKA